MLTIPESHPDFAECYDDVRRWLEAYPTAGPFDWPSNIRNRGSEEKIPASKHTFSRDTYPHTHLRRDAEWIWVAADAKGRKVYGATIHAGPKLQ